MTDHDWNAKARELLRSIGCDMIATSDLRRFDDALQAAYEAGRREGLEAMGAMTSKLDEIKARAATFPSSSTRATIQWLLERVEGLAASVRELEAGIQWLRDRAQQSHPGMVQHWAEEARPVVSRARAELAKLAKLEE